MSHRSITAGLLAATVASLVCHAVVSSPLEAQPPVATTTRVQPYQHAREPIGTLREIYDGVLSPEIAVNTFRNIDRLLPTRTVAPSARPLPLPPSATPLRALRVRDTGREYTLDDFLRLNRVAGVLVLKDGRITLERYQFGNNARTRWMSMSIAKSVTSTLIAVAVKDGAVKSLSDLVTDYVPSLSGSAYDGVTIRDVLLMTSGVRWNEAYTNPASDRRRLLEAQISLKPGSAMALMGALPRAAQPGTTYLYNTGETQVAAEVVRRAVGMPLATFLSERIWSRFGMEHEAKWWLDSPNGVEIGGSGLSATLRDFGRFGLFVLSEGVAAGTSILPAGWMAEASSPKTLRGGKRLDYGYLWWLGTTPARRADHAYAAEGIHGQYLYINPREKVVIVVLSAQPKPTGGAVIDEWLFFDAAVDAMRGRKSPQ